MHKWLTLSLVKTEIYFENCVKRPQKLRFIFPYYEGIDISDARTRKKKHRNRGKWSPISSDENALLPFGHSVDFRWNLCETPDNLTDFCPTLWREHSHSADLVLRNKSADTGCKPVYVTPAQKPASSIVDNAELKWKLCEPTAKMRFKSPL